MKKIQFILIALFAVAAFAAPFKVVGFYPYWAQYSQFYPKDVRYNTVSHIHYSALMPAEDGSISYADENDAPNFEGLAKSASENGVSMVAAIGGFEADGTLATLAADDGLLAAFCDNALEWVNKYGLAGLEIDWQNFSADNGEALSKMAEALKGKLGDKTLSIVVYASSIDAYGDYLNKVDYVTVFIGDQMDESVESVKPNMAKQDIESAVNALTGKGVAADKIVPVLALYGKTFAGAKGLGSSHNGVGSGNEGFIPYKELMSRFDEPTYKVSFDESSATEVAVSESETIVFAGIPSMKAVASWVKESNLGGVAVYDLTQDHHEPIVSLLVTIGQVLRPEINYGAKKKK